MKPSRKKWILFTLVTLACALGTAGLYAMKPEQEAQTREKSPVKQVSFVTAGPGAHPARVKALGEVCAKWTTTIKAQVGGEIVAINDRLMPGHRLGKGEVLLQLDPTNYKAALAQAALELENARVHLIQTEQGAAQARADWKGAGMGQAPSSPLVFHEPQVRAARAQMAYAEQNLEKARKDLDQTVITAPYAGLVTERVADKGETLFSGDPVATLISANDLEVRISLDPAQIRLLGKWQDAGVSLLDPASNRSWPGRLVRARGEANPQTRLCDFFIRVEDQDSDLMPGMFVTALITGTARPGLLALPESALTREGEIWVIDGENRLRRLPAVPVFYESGQVFVETEAALPLTDPALVRVAAMPAPGFIAGAPVDPKPLKMKES